MKALALTEGKEELKAKFLELRAKGYSYDQIPGSFTLLRGLVPTSNQAAIGAYRANGKVGFAFPVETDKSIVWNIKEGEVIMTTAEDYQRQLSILGIDKMTLHASTVQEAKACIDKLQLLKKQLQQVKRNINFDIQSIRTSYQQKQPSATSFSSAIIGGLFGSRSAGSARASVRRTLKAELDGILEPYNRLKLKIDNVLVQIEGGKIKLDQ